MADRVLPWIRVEGSSWSTAGLWALWIVFGVFLVYPLFYVARGAFLVDGELLFDFFALLFTNPVQREALINSCTLGITVTIATSIVALPLAMAMVRREFPGKGILNGLLLVPMVIPPFVGAIGMKQLFARFGSVNQALIGLGVMDRSDPMDWFGSGFWGVVLLESLHLYPIMYLNAAAALANIDPSLEEAGRNLGSSGWTLFRRITMPLMAPGYFAGSIIVFLWAFTDLGTPLMFEYSRVIPVQIFDLVTDIHSNPMGFALVVLVILMTVGFFVASKKLIGSGSRAMMSRGHTAGGSSTATGAETWLIWGGAGILIGVALLPHLSVMLTSVSQRWALSVLPSEYTTSHLVQVFEHPLTVSSIKNSFFLSSLSTLADVLIGVGIAYLLTRKAFRGKNILDTLAMLPLTLPGLVLAFGYVGSFSNTALDVQVNPMPLLVIAYAIRRLPYMVRAAVAGFQQTSVALEEASMNLGASPLRTLRKITLPLVMANLVAGGTLAFSFAMLEVSDSLILATKERFYPITKAMYALALRIADGPYVASAMGVIGMLILGTSLMLAGKFLGRRMGELFRV